MDNEQGFIDDLGGWWDSVTASASETWDEFVEWGTDEEWYSENVKKPIKDMLRTGGEAVGEVTGGAVGSAFGVPPLLILLAVLLAYLTFKKVTV